ncbi:nuclear transport factor 2 family protein [Streptomyces sp. NPDC127069]|uniref:nuclear transport factor 2 family protein n=1 Tax=Streptomyces sp. NPDC127069 TaxID=3347128 RepID=UPI00364720F2
MTSSKADDETVLRDVLERWKSAVDAHEPERVADVFTDDAIFQGLHPYTVGQQGVTDYCPAAAREDGRPRDPSNPQSRPRPGPGLSQRRILLTDRPLLPVFLTVLA